MRVIALMLLVTLSSGAACATTPHDAKAAYVRGYYAATLTIIRPLAAKGLPWAQYNIGHMYRNGQGVAQNYAEATKWYRLAAEQGYAPAQYNIGAMYDKGKGVIQNYAEATKWYRLAAAQSYAKAQNSLGAMYAEGRGVVQDYVRAHMWFNLAAKKWYSGGDRNRDLAAKKMTRQQIAQAQKLARVCQARNFRGCD